MEQKQNIQRPLIFECDTNGYINDERVLWFPEFATMSQEQMTYVALVVDYNSPFYGQPVNDRKRKVKEKIKRERQVEIEHTEAFDIACDLYSEIQYDPLSEQLQSQINLLDVYTKGLNKITKMGTSAQEVSAIDKATTVQQNAEKEIARLEQKQRERIREESKTRGDRLTNFYEVWRKTNPVSKIAMKGIENYLDARA